MEYMSVKEAAKKWGISERYVQRCCTETRIEGAVKFGCSWAIPLDAEKPARMRQNTAKQNIVKQNATKQNNAKQNNAKQYNTKQNDVSQKTVIQNEGKLYTAMPLLNTSWPPGKAVDCISGMEDTDARNIALAEYYYFSGQSAKASDIAEEYLPHKDLALRLSACWLYAYANLALDRIPRARQAMMQVRATIEAIDENTPAVYRIYTICIATGACVLLHLPVPEDFPSLRECISQLPTGFRLFVLYLQAHQAYLDGRYGVCIGIAETALALEESLYPIPAIYLHLVSTMGHINLKQSEQAKEHLLEAWKIAQPDDLIEAFGEHHGLLGGMLETVLRKDYPDDFKRIIDITYSFSAGWRKVHNPDTGHHVADVLTTMEFTVAMLAARGWTNQEISDHLGIRISTVKWYISLILDKLYIEKREQLSQYMLR